MNIFQSKRSLIFNLVDHVHTLGETRFWISQSRGYLWCSFTMVIRNQPEWYPKITPEALLQTSQNPFSQWKTPQRSGTSSFRCVLAQWLISFGHSIYLSFNKKQYSLFTTCLNSCINPLKSYWPSLRKYQTRNHSSTERSNSLI